MLNGRGSRVRASALALCVCALWIGGAAHAQVLDPTQSGLKGEVQRGTVVDRSPRPLGAAAQARTPERLATSEQSSVGAAWDSLNPTLRTGLSLAIVLVTIVLLSAAARRVIKRSGVLSGAIGAASAPAGVLEVLGRYPVARGQTIILLKVERRILMLAQTAGRLRSGGGGLALLAEIDDPEDVASILLKVQEASGTSSGERFKSLLNAFGASHGDGVHEVNGDGSAEWLVESDGDMVDAGSGGLRISELENTGGSPSQRKFRLRGAP